MLWLHRAAKEGDWEKLRDWIAVGEDVDGRCEAGWTPLMNACDSGHLECAQALIDRNAAVDMVDYYYERTALIWACDHGYHGCAQALIDANAAVDMVDNGGQTVLMCACRGGNLECARALIDAGAAVDMVDNNGNTALMEAVASHSLDQIRRECKTESQVYNESGDDSDMDDEVFAQRYERRLQRVSERRLEERRQGRAWCVQALLEAMAPIRGADFSDRASSFKFACERLQVLGQVLASSHVIEHAFVPVEARVVTLTADAQGIVIDFVRAVLESTP